MLWVLGMYPYTGYFIRHTLREKRACSSVLLSVIFYTRRMEDTRVDSVFVPQIFLEIRCIFVCGIICWTLYSWNIRAKKRQGSFPRVYTLDAELRRLLVLEQRSQLRFFRLGLVTCCVKMLIRNFYSLRLGQLGAHSLEVHIFGLDHRFYRVNHLLQNLNLGISLVDDLVQS